MQDSRQVNCGRRLKSCHLRYRIDLLLPDACAGQCAGRNGVRAPRSKGAAFQSTPIITLDALTIAYALAPGLSPSFSADCLVMIDTISIPGANSTTTSVSTAPGFTALTVAGRTLRALNFMKFLLGKSSCHSTQDCIPKRRAFLNPYDRLTS